MTINAQADPGPALSVSANYTLRVSHYVRAFLSIPNIGGQGGFAAKDLLTTAAGPTEGRYSVEEHLRSLADRGDLREDVPLLVLGMRNSLVNLRAPVIWHERAYAVAGEEPEQSLRPYFGLGLRDGALVLDRALGGAGDAGDWPDFFCAGVPVLWDDATEAELFDLMLMEAADHSHIFDLPRGRHHRATDETKVAWSRLHQVFEDHLHSEGAVVAAAMRQAVSECVPPLRRCDDYFHAVIGIDAVGSLVCLFANARLEALGRRLRDLGCRRGICVENSGSVMPTWFPDGRWGPGIPFIRAPNFRDRGRSTLVLELAHGLFESTVGCWT